MCRRGGRGYTGQRIDRINQRRFMDALKEDMQSETERQSETEADHPRW